MLNVKTDRRFGLIILLLWLSIPGICSAGHPADFKARLELHRNGKLTGEMNFQFSSDNGRWSMSSETEGTKGLASWIGLRESSTAEGEWHEGSPRPIRYDRNVKAIKTMRWSAEFDWDAGVVRTVYPDGESVLELEPGTLDELALSLAIRQGLGRGEKEWFFRQVDEDEIDDVHFRTAAVKRLQTALGCMTVHVVEKVRAEGSKRYTRTYYAAEHGFTPVLIEHGKRDSEHVEGRVISLTLNGQPVAGGPDCSP